VTTKLLAVVVACAALVVGCGSSKEPAGHALAAKACQSSGQTAATDAAQAATLNSAYNTLAVDEKSLATQVAQGGGLLGSGAAAALTLAPGAEEAVIGDCIKLGLPATPTG
jgi:hypothetical protein